MMFLDSKQIYQTGSYNVNTQIASTTMKLAVIVLRLLCKVLLSSVPADVEEFCKHRIRAELQNTD